MAHPHYVVLCYDVVRDGRRGRLQRKLKRHLLTVQKSVFEGPLEAHQLERVLRLVESIIDPETDTVRVYLPCDGCRASTVLIGTAQPAPDGRDPILV